jgi:hypothetical protein
MRELQANGFLQCPIIATLHITSMGYIRQFGLVNLGCNWCMNGWMHRTTKGLMVLVTRLAESFRDAKA